MVRGDEKRSSYRGVLSFTIDSANSSWSYGGSGFLPPRGFRTQEHAHSAYLDKVLVILYS